jgi:hypothetical protein
MAYRGGISIRPLGGAERIATFVLEMNLQPAALEAVDLTPRIVQSPSTALPTGAANRCLLRKASIHAVWVD